MAVPFLHTYRGHVFHQVRDPIAVVNSLCNGELSEPEAAFYAQFMNLHTPGGWEDTVEASVRFCVHWLQTVEQWSELSWRVEDVTPELVQDICRRVGRPVDRGRAEAAVQMVPHNVNEHNPKPGLRWADLPDIPATALLKAHAERWGYPTT
jgi:hypothetical protein